MTSSDNANIGPTFAITTHEHATTVPGLLRLPTEIRLQIFELLASEKVYFKRGNDDAPFELQYWTSTKIFKASAITRVCRRLRHEAIPIVYGNFRWIINFRVPLNLYRVWIETVDPYAFRCLQGITLKQFAHGDLREKMRSSDINLDFQCKPVRAAVVRCGYGSRNHRPHLEARCQECIDLAERFAREIDIDRARTKQIVVNMIMEMERVAFMPHGRIDEAFQEGWQATLSRPMEAYLFRATHGVMIDPDRWKTDWLYKMDLDPPDRQTAT